MFLTTEPSIANKTYTPLRVIFGAGSSADSHPSYKNVERLEVAIEQALAALEREAYRLEADAVIGVHTSISATGWTHNAVVVGTAIKFTEH